MRYYLPVPQAADRLAAEEPVHLTGIFFFNLSMPGHTVTWRCHKAPGPYLPGWDIRFCIVLVHEKKEAQVTRDTLPPSHDLSGDCRSPRTAGAPEHPGRSHFFSNHVFLTISFSPVAGNASHPGRA